ncbi:MAG: glutamate 5-kinase [Eubacteriales bacterium]|nr:glutamate 5-kinase [Eubacteriales bacterium]
MVDIYERIKKSRRIVVKIGTSTLTYDNGKVNIRKFDQIARVISDINNSGREVILVSSGAGGVAMGKLGYSEKPKDIRRKQAFAAVGQCELMYMYDKMFSDYNCTVAQILLTKDDIDVQKRRNNMQNTFGALLEMNIIPIVNENDTVSTEEIEFGDNDILSAYVAELVDADLLVLFSDIDGLYDKDPHKNPDAKLIRLVEDAENTECDIGGAGSNRGTGGMKSKIHAAFEANNAGIDMIITNGKNIASLYDILEGKPVGTLFIRK